MWGISCGISLGCREGGRVGIDNKGRGRGDGLLKNNLLIMSFNNEKIS